MTLPTSGSISILNLKTEFGGNTSPKLTDYYAGGAFVPAGTTDVDGNPIPSSGTIKLTNFYGAPNPVKLQGHSVSTTDSTATRAGVQLRSDGRFDEVAFYNNNYWYTASSTEWYKPDTTGIGSSYQARATQSSGDVIYGDSLNTWLDLSSNRLWEVRAPYNSVNSATILVEIRRSSDLKVIASGTMTLYARQIV